MSGLQRRHILAAYRDAASVPVRSEPCAAAGLRVGPVAQSQRRDAIPPAEDDRARPVVVAVSGALDLASIGAVRDDLYSRIRAGSGWLILDLSRVRLCDAAAMSGLVQVGRRCAEWGGWLRLAEPAGIVAKVFRIVSLGRDIEIYPTVTAAAAGREDDRIMR
jgi:anti-anti-sigma factor